MSTLNTPLQLSTVFKPKIWGREDLAPIYPAQGETDLPVSRKAEISKSATKPGELIGEVWSNDDTSRFLNGPVAGLTLAEASAKYGPALHGRAWEGARFPLLAKYIFTSDWLSVQVHPDDDYARVHDPGNVGKCEMWYILQADPNAEILVGVKPGVTREALKSAFEKGKSKELLIRHRPKAEEAVFIPPGTVHALGPGLVLFEVEQNSDLTYRLDDYGRPGLDGKTSPSPFVERHGRYNGRSASPVPPAAMGVRGVLRYSAVHYGLPLLRSRRNILAQESHLQEFAAASGGLFNPAR